MSVRQMQSIRFFIGYFLLCLAGLPGTAFATTPATPSLKPLPVFSSDYAEPDQFRLLVKGLRAADNGNQKTIQDIRAQTTDPIITKILLWKLAHAPNTNFSVMDEALESLKNWPAMHTVRRRAENSISKNSLPHQDKYLWLTKNPPITGQGKLTLADLMRNIVPISREKRHALIREAWRHDNLPLKTVRNMLDTPQSPLTIDDHQARTDMLLWKGKYRETRMMLPHLRRSDRRLAEARLALQEKQPNVDYYVTRVPETRASQPGLLYDRAHWRRKKGRIAKAVPLLLSLHSADAPEIARHHIWKERSIAIRYLIRERRFADAYALAVDHGLKKGIHFAEAEWTAGWLALRRLHNAHKAAGHFRSLSAAVRTPISKTRAEYWLGRALETLEQKQEAQAAYARAAAWPFTFYGQLAAEQYALQSGQIANLDLPHIPEPNEKQRLDFMQTDLVRAAILLADAGRRKDFEIFSMQLDDRLKTPEEHLMLYELAQSYMQPRAALRSAKTGLSRGMLAPNAVWPRPSLPPNPDSQVEEALVLALSRQESEFNPLAISHAGAVGMMQLMPQTAKGAARKAGLSWNPSWLKDDPHYNITLGRTHLDQLIKRFNGSYVMALAAYNAGANRPIQWAREYGDPRTGLIDIVDWIESIPFSETRNYVQRVLESLQVYRQRIQGQPIPIQLSQDLQRGSVNTQNPS